MTVNLTINNTPIQAQSSQTIFSAARENGIQIPTLCYHKDLSPVGSCRLCVVEVEKWRGQVAACTLEVTEGMVVYTESPTIHQSRRTMSELLLQNYCDSGYAENDQHHNEFMYWVNRYAARLPASVQAKPKFREDSDSNPFLWVDFNKCILWTRCVRVGALRSARELGGLARGLP